MIIDCCTLFNELDLLEIRLNSLAPYVDKFVVCEWELTHSGKRKKLFLDENWDRFNKFNIIYLVPNGYCNPDPWRMENYQRNYLYKGIEGERSDSTILISDVDEIPNLVDYKFGSNGVSRQKLYYYYLNGFTGKNNWKGTIVTKKSDINAMQELRNRRNKILNFTFSPSFADLVVQL